MKKVRSQTLENALNQYSQGIIQIKGYSSDNLLGFDAFKVALKILMARDTIESCISTELDDSELFMEIDRLDRAFEKEKSKVFWAARYPESKHLLKNIIIPEKKDWWKSLYKIGVREYLRNVKPVGDTSKIRVRLSNIGMVLVEITTLFIDKFDGLWKLLTILLLTVSSILAVNLVPHFWHSEINSGSLLSIILPSLFALILGTDTFQQITNGYGLLERNLKRIHWIHPVFKQEFAFVMSIILCVSLGQIYGNLSSFSDCYYN
jgi:hypothetical protein